MRFRIPLRSIRNLMILKQKQAVVGRNLSDGKVNEAFSSVLYIFIRLLLVTASHQLPAANSHK